MESIGNIQNLIGERIYFVSPDDSVPEGSNVSREGVWLTFGDYESS